MQPSGPLLDLPASARALISGPTGIGASAGIRTSEGFDPGPRGLAGRRLEQERPGVYPERGKGPRSRTEVWFTDYGFGKLENGRARILLDPAFAQTINPAEPYHVFVQSYGDAELYVLQRTPLGFEVALREGAPNAEFSYRIVAKRLHFEGNRLEPAPWADQLNGTPTSTSR